MLVFNDTKVIPAQLEGRRGEARIGATLHKREGAARPGAPSSATPGVCARATGSTSATASPRSAGARGGDGSLLLDFEGEEPVELLLERAGRMPLPPYIAGKREADARDAEDYQTMFAAEKGAVAAPTAALHFTPRLIEALTRRGSATRPSPSTSAPAPSSRSRPTTRPTT